MLVIILLDELDGAYNTRGKVKLSLCLIKHCAMKAFGGVEVCLQPFLTLALTGDEWSVYAQAPLPPPVPGLQPQQFSP
jgi:hypothetical protein